MARPFANALSPVGCRTRISFLCIFSLTLVPQAFGFRGFQRSYNRPVASITRSWGCTVVPALDRTVPSPLFMSDVPQDQDDDSREMRERRNGRTTRLPPSPEDFIVMAGDLVSLMIYGFTDHFVCQDLAAAVSSSPTTVTSSGISFGEGLSAADMPPVWLDATHPYSSHVLQVLQYDMSVTQYSPLLQPMGLAACLLGAAWLLSGWAHEAFSFRNTLDCTTHRALTVTAKAWITSCLFMLLAVGLSNMVLVPGNDGLSLTKGDITYICDTLTVLSMWRFLASSMLGSGRD